jgi:hypothetical protein
LSWDGSGRQPFGDTVDDLSSGAYLQDLIGTTAYLRAMSDADARDVEPP